MRAVSTTIDVAVFLLLVTAAVAAVTIPSTSPPSTEVDEAADSLASSTERVDYRVTVPADAYDADRRLVDNRTANRTVAALLAAAAVSDASLDGTDLRFRDTSFSEHVRNRTTDLLRWIDGPVAVTAEWRVYEGAPLNGSVSVGRSAGSAETTTAVVVVPGPVPAVQDEAVAAAENGFDAVAATVANATVAGLLPPASMELALEAGGLPRGLALARYDAFVRELDVYVVDALEAGRIEPANERLAAALASRLAADMRSRFEDPTAAASAARAGSVRIVVRGWDP